MGLVDGWRQLQQPAPWSCVLVAVTRGGKRVVLGKPKEGSLADCNRSAEHLAARFGVKFFPGEAERSLDIFFDAKGGVHLGHVPYQAWKRWALISLAPVAFMVLVLVAGALKNGW